MTKLELLHQLTQSDLHDARLRLYRAEAALQQVDTFLAASGVFVDGCDYSEALGKLVEKVIQPHDHALSGTVEPRPCASTIAQHGCSCNKVGAACIWSGLDFKILYTCPRCDKVLRHFTL